MLEKLTCCLAHPMTALRTLKNKINEVITAHNALVNKVDNLPTGGGSGDTGGGSASSPGMLVITAPITGEVDGGLRITPDKTFSEIWDAVTHYQCVALDIPQLFEEDDVARIYPSIYYTGTVEFCLYVAGITVNAIITENMDDCSLFLIIPE